MGNGQILLRSGGVPHGLICPDRWRLLGYGEGPNQQVPLDGALNLPEWKYSYLLQDWGLTFSSHEAGEAGKILDKILGLNLAVRTLERVSVKVSGGVEPFRKDQVPPQGEEHELVATSDCKGVPLTKDQSAASLKRRGKGEKANKKKMACVGAVYAIVPFPRSVDEILNECASRVVHVQTINTSGRFCLVGCSVDQEPFGTTGGGLPGMERKSCGA